jgi:hypothetical protein
VLECSGVIAVAGGTRFEVCGGLNEISTVLQYWSSSLKSQRESCNGHHLLFGTKSEKCVNSKRPTACHIIHQYSYAMI